MCVASAINNNIRNTPQGKQRRVPQRQQQPGHELFWNTQPEQQQQRRQQLSDLHATTGGHTSRTEQRGGQQEQGRQYDADTTSAWHNPPEQRRKYDTDTASSGRHTPEQEQQRRQQYEPHAAATGKHTQREQQYQQYDADTTTAAAAAGKHTQQEMRRQYELHATTGKPTQQEQQRQYELHATTGEAGYTEPEERRQSNLYTTGGRPWTMYPISTEETPDYAPSIAGTNAAMAGGLEAVLGGGGWGPQFTVVSYNVLADSLVSFDYIPYCRSWNDAAWRARPGRTLKKV